MSNFLKKEETTNNKTQTYQVLTQLDKRTEKFYEAYKRSHDFALMLFNKLTSRGYITREEFDNLEALFYHSDLSITEIFNQVFN